MKTDEYLRYMKNLGKLGPYAYKAQLDCMSHWKKHNPDIYRQMEKKFPKLAKRIF